MTLPALVAVITGLLAVPIASPSDDELSRLTVPADRLPKGCRLAPLVRPDPSGKPRADFGPLGPNPWIGNRPASMATIRHAVEGRPDNDLQGPALYKQLEQNLVAAYEAKYLAEDGGTVTVWAVRYDDPKLAMTPLLKTAIQGDVARIVFGSSAARVSWSFGRTMRSAPVETCYRAVRDHISALK